MNFMNSNSDPQMCFLCKESGASPGCFHKGKWHSRYNDCSLSCAIKLGMSNIGSQHYSCCFSTDKDSKCLKSFHVFQNNDAVINDNEIKEQSDGTIKSSVRTSDCPRYMVNLDAPSKERWAHVIKDFTAHFPAVIEFIDELIGSGIGVNVVTGVLSGINKIGKVYYSEEIEGIASVSGYPVGKIAMLQIAYEVFAACTSVVVDMPVDHLNASTETHSDSSNVSAPFHIRTMDWDMDVLKALTIEVDYMRDGCLVARATTWAGYVGILTGMKPGVASVSVNYRRTIDGNRNMLGGIMTNMLRGLGNAWPVSFLVREALLDMTSFSSMVAVLETSPLMAPTYVTVAGVHAGEGKVITREREGSVQPWCLNEQGPIVQTNMDHFNMHPSPEQSSSASATSRSGSSGAVDSSAEDFEWQDICDSRYREQAARLALSHMNTDEMLTTENFWALFSISPCLADDTVYTVAMCPRTGLYVTRAQVSPSDRRLGRKTWKRVMERGGLINQDAYRSGATRF